MRWGAWLSSLLLAACSFQWGAPEAELALTGTPPEVSSLRKLNQLPAGPATILRGADGTPWAAFCEYRTGATRSSSFRGCGRLHLAALTSDGAPTRPDEVRLADSFVVRRGAIYALTVDKMLKTRTVTVHRPGDRLELDNSFTVSADDGLIYTNDGGSNDVFVWWTLSADATSYHVYRRDRRDPRVLEIPRGVDPTVPQATMDFLFTADGDTLVESDPDGNLTAYATLTNDQRALGKYPGSIFIDNVRRAVLVVGDDFRSVPLDGGADTVLSTVSFSASTLAEDGLGNAWYRYRGGLYRVPFDGSAAPELVVQSAARLLAVGPTGQAVYSRDNDSRFVNGAGDGWLGDWNFLERGFFACFRPDGGRLYALEHAATTTAVGTLVSLPAPGGPAAGGGVRSLALNVGRADCLDDGRIFAVENQAALGSWNRLVQLDEERGEARYLLAGAADFVVVPGGRELLVDVVSGASGYDIVRLPLAAP